jgi:xanthine phosphoribosyltransferase
VDLARIVAERAHVEGSIVRVDRFLNHRVEPHIITAFASAVAERTADLRFDVIVTAEASGIAAAMATAMATGLPFIYAKKISTEDATKSHQRTITSPTKGTITTLWISPAVLEGATRALVVDDFLARGSTSLALAEMLTDAGCEIAGFCFLVEKAYEPGRGLLEARGWVVRSIVSIVGIEGGTVTTEETR